MWGAAVSCKMSSVCVCVIMTTMSVGTVIVHGTMGVFVAKKHVRTVYFSTPCKLRVALSFLR